MNSYRIEGGTAQIGLGEVLGLTAAQLAPRRHLVDVMETQPDGLTIVRAKQLLQFKAGEVVALAAEPAKGQAALFVSPDAPAADAGDQKAPAAKAKKK